MLFQFKDFAYWISFKCYLSGVVQHSNDLPTAARYLPAHLFPACSGSVYNMYKITVNVCISLTLYSSMPQLLCNDCNTGIVTVFHRSRSFWCFSVYKVILLQFPQKFCSSCAVKTTDVGHWSLCSYLESVVVCVTKADFLFLENYLLKEKWGELMTWPEGELRQHRGPCVPVQVQVPAGRVVQKLKNCHELFGSSGKAGE